MRACLPLGLALLAALLAGCLAPPGPAGPARAFGDVRRYAAPGGLATEGVVVCGDRVLASGSDAAGPALFVLDRATGAEVERFAVEVPGERVDNLLGLVLDAAGRVYAAPVGVLRLARGAEGWAAEVYARVADLAPCGAAPPPCSPTRRDQPPFPNMPAFDAAGNLYLSDTFQATLRVAGPRGGDMVPWFQDPRFDCGGGPNGLVVHPGEGRLYTVMFALQASDPLGIAACPAVNLWSLPLVERPAAADLRLVHAYEPAAGGDGLAFGASGRLYVTLNLLNQVSVLDPAGGEVARFPTPAANAAADRRLDGPANVAFLDERRSLVVTNLGRAFEMGGVPPEVSDVFVDDTALGVPAPSIP